MNICSSCPGVCVWSVNRPLLTERLCDGHALYDWYERHYQQPNAEFCRQLGNAPPTDVLGRSRDVPGRSRDVLGRRSGVLDKAVERR